MENNQQQLKFNDLTREVVEDFISKMSKEDKKNLREYVEAHPRDSSSSMFAMVKSYIYNKYFRAKPVQENKTRGNTFADALEFLLSDDEENEE